MAMQDGILDTVKNGAKKAIPAAIGDSPDTEGTTTKKVENQTAKAPSMFWLGLAVGSMAGSAILLATARKKEYANFVGMWAPCFMLIGIYNKLVKLEGNDRFGGAKDSSVAEAPFGTGATGANFAH